MNLEKLGIELSDPKFKGLDDEQIANALNTADREVDVEVIDTGVVVASITREEFGKLSHDDKEYVGLLARRDTLPATATIKAELTALLPTLNLKRSGSRAEELGLGNVTPSQVADAKRLSKGQIDVSIKR